MKTYVHNSYIRDRAEVTPESLFADVDRIAAWFARRHCHVSASSRITRYSQIVRKVAGSREPPPELLARGVTLDREQAVAVQAMREISELSAIAANVPEDRFHNKISMLTGGHLLPEDEPELSPARDTQFELLVAGAVSRTGWIVEDDKPDVVFGLDGARIGLAVKRVKSRLQLDKNVRDGKRQIEERVRARSIDLGLVVLNISSLMCPALVSQPLPVFDSVDDALDKVHSMCLDPVSDHIEQYAHRRAHASCCIGFIIQCQVPYVLRPVNAWNWASAWVVRSRRTTESRMKGVIDRLYTDLQCAPFL